jgi:hypothetical protein
MRRTGLRIFCLLSLALAASACGADAGSPTIAAVESLPPTWTDSAPTPEITPLLQESPGPETPLPADATPEITVDSGGGEPTAEPTIDTSGAGATPEPTIPASGTVRPAGTPTGPRCDDSQFLEDVTIPDGTTLKPGETFKKTWRLKNTGVCTWTTNYKIGFAYGEQMHGVDTKLSNSVSPGAIADISVTLTAPLFNFWYGSWWRMKNDHGENFGDFVYVSVIVAEGLPYPTPTPG